jgi:signal transduction histidine kinase
MKSFGVYISKHLASFTAFILVLLFINAVVFEVTFHRTFTIDYGETSPRVMLEMTAATSTLTGVSEETARKLRQNNIWAIYLNQDGECIWSIDLPDEVPESYTIQDVALFAKGYIEDYPVFAWNTNDGLLVLGYPKDSYTKLTSNYYSIPTIKMLPFFIIGILAVDLLLLFSAYFFSKRKIIRNTEPIIAAVETLSDGKPISLRINGDLSEVADSVNRASRILSKQNEARANWISGVSHDIRTPLSVIMGYAGRIAGDKSASSSIKEQAEIVRKQSIKIKELVQDLNLVSQLEYEMQPLHKEPVRLSKVIRSYVAELLNMGIFDTYTIEIEITSDAETAVLECDVRLISRAINNLVQNSIKHNPRGCKIRIILEATGGLLVLVIEDNGTGLSAEKMQELEEKPHYMESTDERLDLRHGLGLLIVRQVAEAHNGSMAVRNCEGGGCKIALSFSR